jgi:hypothetical protein
MSTPLQKQTQLAEQLADLCAEALAKAGFPIPHGGKAWEGIADAIEQNMVIS